jgi:hypothetical protein
MGISKKHYLARIKGGKSEDNEQVEVLRWLDENGIYYIHIPNHKRMRFDLGAKSGAPDLVLILNDGRVVWLEMKKLKGGRVSPSQKIVHGELISRRQDVVLAKGAEEAISALEKYLTREK